MLPFTVLLNPLISRVSSIWTALSITAQYPSVREQIIHMSHDTILRLHYCEGMFLGQTSIAEGEAPAEDCTWGLLHVSVQETADIGTAQRCRWAPQRDVHQSAAAWTHCSVLSFVFQRKKMVTVWFTNVRNKCSRVQVYELCSLHWLWTGFEIILFEYSKKKNQKPLL